MIISVDNTRAPLLIAVNNNGGVQGLTVTAALRNVNNGFYLDFNDNIFKSSGWVIKETTLTDASGGFYFSTVDFSIINLIDIFHLIVEYRITGAITGIEQALISLVREDIRIKELWQLQGLDNINPMTVTEIRRTVEDINLNITGDAATTATVTRASIPLPSLITDEFGNILIDELGNSIVG